MVLQFKRAEKCVSVCWDWDWDSVYTVSIFDTETETFKIGIKFWVSKIETETETIISLKHLDWYWDFWFKKNIIITLYDPEHTF